MNGRRCSASFAVSLTLRAGPMIGDALGMLIENQFTITNGQLVTSDLVTLRPDFFYREIVPDLRVEKAS